MVVSVAKRRAFTWQRELRFLDVVLLSDTACAPGDIANRHLAPERG